MTKKKIAVQKKPVAVEKPAPAAAKIEKIEVELTDPIKIEPKRGRGRPPKAEKGGNGVVAPASKKAPAMPVARIAGGVLACLACLWVFSHKRKALPAPATVTPIRPAEEKSVNPLFM